MKKIKDIPEKDRPREKLVQNGAASLTDAELMSIILGKGTKKNNVVKLADKIIKVIDDKEKGIDFKIDDILDINGIGIAKATTISAAFEFVRRRIKPEGIKITKPSDVLPLIRHYIDRKQEYFLSISLNGANEVIKVRIVTIGLVNQSQVHPREIFADILMDRASSVIVAHNHPSGNVIPSNDDIEVTLRLKNAAKILGISFLDHIIFSNKDYYSLKENNRL